MHINGFSLAIHGWFVNLDSWKSRWHLMFRSHIQKNSQPWRNWVVVSNIFIFNPIWGRFPFWPIFFRWVETTISKLLGITTIFTLRMNLFFCFGVFLGPQNDATGLKGGFSDSSGRTSQMFLRGTFLVTRWWFQTFFDVHPYLGRWSNLTCAYFFKWVETTTNQKKQRTCPVSLVFISHVLTLGW